MIFGISYYQLFELVAGALTIWVGIYLVSRNPFSTLSWITFLFLLGLGYVLYNDPVLLNTPDMHNYIIWQKVTDWPLYFSTILYFHASLLASNKYNNKTKNILLLSYLIAGIIYILDIRGGLILREGLVRYSDFRRFDGFVAGVLLVPVVLFECIYALSGSIIFLKVAKINFIKNFLPFLAGIMMTATALFVILGFYMTIPLSDKLFTFGWALGGFFFVYSLIRYHLFMPSEKIIFDRGFYYRTLLIFIFVGLYLVILPLSGIKYSFNALVLSNFLILLVLFTHSFYDWFGTFINDILYNISSGFSVVTDQEINEIIKNYNNPGKIENSSLLRLNIVRKKIKAGGLPVDSLREIVKNAIEFFRPENEPHHRIKANLKYQLLRMITFDQAEEGQILWELGFMEYPTRIISREKIGREPLFFAESASDYSYTSRNAYLALKKEAIHDVTWRISYLEKMSKKLNRII